jgi:hypothetical protein
MAIDQPVVVYPKDKSNAKNGGHTAAEMNRLADEHARSHKSMVGRQISLGGYLNYDMNSEIKGK